MPSRSCELWSVRIMLHGSCPALVADAHVSDAWTCDYLSVCLVSVIIYHAQMQVSVYISYADDMLVNAP